MYVCICRAVTRDEFDRAVGDGARTIEDVGEFCGAGTGCGGCHERLAGLLASAADASFAERGLDALAVHA